MYRPALSICRCPSCATAECCLSNRTGLLQLLGEVSSVSGLLSRKSNLVAPFQPILFFDWFSKPCLDFRSGIHRHLIVSWWYFDEQNLCAWRRFLSIDNARLDHIKVTLPEYVLLGGGQVQIRGQPGRHVLKFERLLMSMRRFELPLVLVTRDTNLNQ